MICNRDHTNIDIIVRDLPIGQEGSGRHKCASCAYERGYSDGLNKVEQIDLTTLFNSLDESQRGAHRHISPHAAYALGYFNGVNASYNR